MLVWLTWVEKSSSYPSASFRLHVLFRSHGRRQEGIWVRCLWLSEKRQAKITCVCAGAVIWTHKKEIQEILHVFSFLWNNNFSQPYQNFPSIPILPPSLFHPHFIPLLSCQSLTSNHQLVSPICLPHPSLLLSFQKRVGVPWTSARPNISSNDMIMHLLSY